VTFGWREFSVDQDLSMSVKAAPCTPPRGVWRVCAADALVRAVPRLVWAGRLGAQSQSIKSPIQIIVAAIDISIYVSDIG
jgi:hypothetical protein